LSVPAEQAETAALLRRLSGADPIETHISLVFPGPDAVWKLKKAVRLPFLDFSSPEARRHFAERELSLNGAAAPGLYRDVVAVRRGADGRLGLAEGEPVDWVLRMARVPAADFIDARAVAPWHRCRMSIRSPGWRAPSPATSSRRCRPDCRPTRLPRGATRCRARLPRSSRGSARAPRRASCGARTAICISAICASGRAARCRSTRWSSTRRWRASTSPTISRSC
jgi:hypothetical protein